MDAFYNGIADLNELLYRGLSLTENGRVRWYAAAIAAGNRRICGDCVIPMILLWLIVILLVGGVWHGRLAAGAPWRPAGSR